MFFYVRKHNTNFSKLRRNPMHGLSYYGYGKDMVISNIKTRHCMPYLSLNDKNKY